MPGFFFGGAVLVALATLFLVFTRARAPRASDAENPNLNWLQLRTAAVEADTRETATTLTEEAALRVLDDEDTAVVGSSAELSFRLDGFWRLLLFVAPVLAVLPWLIYQQTGSIADVEIAEGLGLLGSDSDAVDRDQLVDRIALRSDERPGNLAYLNLLGRIYIADENYAAAAERFSRLLEQAPDNPEALAMTAQARFLAADRQLDAQSQLLAEKALAADPRQRTALGLLGMAAFERGAFVGAVDYWTRLLELQQPGSAEYATLAGIVDLARERAGIAPRAPDDESLAGLAVEVRLGDELVVDPDAVVYVFARAGQAVGGPPIAVRRLSASELPARLELTDADAMAGQMLSTAGPVRVFAQLSANGKPGVANALYTGVSASGSVGKQETPLLVELRPPQDAQTAPTG